MYPDGLACHEIDASFRCRPARQQIAFPEERGEAGPRSPPDSRCRTGPGPDSPALRRPRSRRAGSERVSRAGAAIQALGIARLAHGGRRLDEHLDEVGNALAQPAPVLPARGRGVDENVETLTAQERGEIGDHGIEAVAPRGRVVRPGREDLPQRCPIRATRPSRPRPRACRRTSRATVVFPEAGGPVSQTAQLTAATARRARGSASASNRSASRTDRMKRKSLRRRSSDSLGYQTGLASTSARNAKWGAITSGRDASRDSFA